jgi:D-alanine--poly(phosphoribitol) ligase subunit 2
MEKILAILQEVRPDIDFSKETALFEDGLLDSFDIVSIISELNDAYSISIRVNELTPDNFNSVESIVRMVERLKNHTKAG